MTWILLGVAVGLASPFLILHRQRRRAAARVGLSVADAPEYVMPPRNPFAAVTIQPCAESPCAAAQAIDNRRFLAVQAPQLPLPGCDRKRCGCRYVRHADRRMNGDRRKSAAQATGFASKPGTNRRIRNDDRRTD